MFCKLGQDGCLSESSEKPYTILHHLTKVGNLLLAVLGITSIITPITVMDQDLLSKDIFWMLGISFLILPLVFFPKGLRLGWRDGLVLLAFYAIFVYMTIK